MNVTKLCCESAPLTTCHFINIHVIHVNTNNSDKLWQVIWLIQTNNLSGCTVNFFLTNSLKESWVIGSWTPTTLLQKCSAQNSGLHSGNTKTTNICKSVNYQSVMNETKFLLFTNLTMFYSDRKPLVEECVCACERKREQEMTKGGERHRAEQRTTLEQ